MSALPLSVTQDKAHHKVSDRYTQINTSLIIEKLLDSGFEMYEAKEAHVRKKDNVGFQKHLVTLKYTELETAEGVPTVVIRNSHNRTSGLSLFSGYIRFACFNGLIAGTGIEDFHIRHKRSWETDVDTFLDRYVDTVYQLQADYDMMKNYRMSAYMEIQFVRKAAELRYSLDDYMDVRELSRIKRIEDRGNDLYRIFNRVQENLLAGDFERRIVNVSEELGRVESWGKAKVITNTEEIVRLNRGLHDIAMGVLN